MKFFIKAKDKKRINDSDIALIRSNYPTILITPGELTKKAEQFIKNVSYLSVVKI